VNASKGVRAKFILIDQTDPLIKNSVYGYVEPFVIEEILKDVNTVFEFERIGYFKHFSYDAINGVHEFLRVVSLRT
jgi:hypothetical protein